LANDTLRFLSAARRAPNRASARDIAAHGSHAAGPSSSLGERFWQTTTLQPCTGRPQELPADAQCARSHDALVAQLGDRVRTVPELREDRLRVLTDKGCASAR
jgi:hypothetical protein